MLWLETKRTFCDKREGHARSKGAVATSAVAGPPSLLRRTCSAYELQPARDSLPEHLVVAVCSPQPCRFSSVFLCGLQLWTFEHSRPRCALSDVRMKGGFPANCVAPGCLHTKPRRTWKSTLFHLTSKEIWLYITLLKSDQSTEAIWGPQNVLITLPILFCYYHNYPFAPNVLIRNSTAKGVGGGGGEKEPGVEKCWN